VNKDNVLLEKRIQKTAPVLPLEAFTGSQPPDKTEFIKNIYFPNWSNKPDELPPVTSLAHTPILTYQNMTAVIANPGSGKSSIMEAIMSAYLNPEADNLGFEVDNSCKGIIYIDNERTNTDVWNSFSRMCRRAGIAEGAEVNNVVIAGMRSIPRLKERIEAIEYLLDNNPCSLLLIDGAGDLVYDTNDLEQAIECRIWLRAITVKYNLSVIVTLHPNPGTNKPRGHQGSEICREAECVLLVKPYEGDVKLITSDFENGKNRNNPKLTTAFVWSDTNMMFITADYEDAQASKQEVKDKAKRNQAELLAKKLLPAPTSLTYTELSEAIADANSLSLATANRRVKEWATWKIITKHVDDRYRLNIKN
jgi:hypothetical protein